MLYTVLKSHIKGTLSYSKKGKKQNQALDF